MNMAAGKPCNLKQFVAGKLSIGEDHMSCGQTLRSWAKA